MIRTRFEFPEATSLKLLPRQYLTSSSHVPSFM